MKNTYLKVVYAAALSLFVLANAGATELSDQKAAFSKQLAEFLPNVKPDSVRKSPIKGLYEVIVGPRVYYFSPDARYLISANIIDLKARENVTKPILHSARKKSLAQIGDANVITFSPKEPKYLLSAFTDIDCGYCRKMHSQIKEYNKLGIGIRYLFYPRAGLGSESYKKAVSVWCSKDKKAAFTQSKAGASIPVKSCDNPVEKHMALVQQMELRGTPALVLPSGELIESYIPPADLLKLLQARDGPSSVQE